jgi:hypothetical protein
VRACSSSDRLTASSAEILGQSPVSTAQPGGDAA